MPGNSAMGAMFKNQAPELAYIRQARYSTVQSISRNCDLCQNLAYHKSGEYKKIVNKKPLPIDTHKDKFTWCCFQVPVAVHPRMAPPQIKNHSIALE